MDYMFEAGFLGTRAPFFMDFVTLIVALLPFLMAFAIWFAKKKMFTLHKASQLILFIVSLIVVGYFEYGVRVGGGFEAFVKESSLSMSFLFGFLIFHIIIAIVTVIWWAKTIIQGMKSDKDGSLPGRASMQHRKDGMRTMVGVFLTSFTGIWVYLFLFLY